MLNLPQGFLRICMEWVVWQTPDFNTVWCGQVLKIFDWSYSTFTDIRALKVTNECHIITIYRYENKKYGKKAVVTVEPGTGIRTIRWPKIESTKCAKVDTTIAIWSPQWQCDMSKYIQNIIPSLITNLESNYSSVTVSTHTLPWTLYVMLIPS